MLGEEQTSLTDIEMSMTAQMLMQICVCNLQDFHLNQSMVSSGAAQLWVMLLGCIHQLRGKVSTCHIHYLSVLGEKFGKDEKSLASSTHPCQHHSSFILA